MKANFTVMSFWLVRLMYLRNTIIHWLMSTMGINQCMFGRLW